MKFYIDDLPVYFPYSYIYPEQYKYMVKLKQCLDAKGPCILEMPSGTGKTVSLLSLITSYQLAYPDKVGKFIYCSRTVTEIEKSLEEAKRVFAYRDQELGANAPKYLCIGMSSRRNLCIHPRVSEFKQGVVVDAKCRNLTASWVRQAAQQDSSMELCEFYEGLEKNGRDALLHGVYTLEDLRIFGEKKKWCPYFLARHCILFADVIVFSYQYILDPKISNLIAKEFKENSIVVFDEAHNIDNVCIDALSVHLNRATLEASSRNIITINENLREMKASNAERLRNEYQRLVEGLANSGAIQVSDEVRADPVLSEQVLREVMPGNMRRAEHFMSLMKRLVEHLKGWLRTRDAVSDTPLSFLQSLYQSAAIEPKSLRFCSTRLNSILHTLQLPDMDQFTPISIVADFATIAGTYSKGFLIIIEPQQYGNDSILQFCCLDASLAMKPVLDKYRSVVITSGTISPLDMYPRMLNFTPVASEKFSMSLTRNSVCPLIIGRGSDQVPITSRFDVRNDSAVVRNFGNLLVEMSAVVPDGIVCFFTSYSYMEQIVSMWNEMGLLNQVLNNKLLFVEVPDSAETALALENYKKACNSGRGAVLFSVARGKVSEGIDFDHQYGRCVIMFGIPYVNTESRVLKARLEFLRDNYQIKEAEFLTFDAMRTTAQCMGRIIRGKTDYGIMVFADKRFSRTDKRNKLPQWISEFLTNENINLSIDTAVGIARRFLKEIAQPWTRDEQLGKSLWTIDHIQRFNNSNP